MSNLNNPLQLIAYSSWYMDDRATTKDATAAS